jgi:hypothetical protein
VLSLLQLKGQVRYSVTSIGQFQGSDTFRSRRRADGLFRSLMSDEIEAEPIPKGPALVTSTATMVTLKRFRSPKSMANPAQDKGEAEVIFRLAGAVASAVQLI